MHEMSFMIAPTLGAIGGACMGACEGWENTRGKPLALRIVAAAGTLIPYGFAGLLMIGLIGAPFDAFLVLLVDTLATVREVGWSFGRAACAAVELGFVVGYPAFLVRELFPKRIYCNG